jgi:DNA-binding winged helix-turn-helix (wHTH) protein
MDGMPQPLVYEFGDFRLDVRHHLLSDGRGEPVVLSPRAFDLLVYFAEHGGELLDKATLMKAVWPNVVVEENNLSQHLSALRRALGDGQEGRRYIVTIPRRGYRFVADVRRGVSPSPTADRSRARLPQGLRVVENESSPPASVAVLPFANLSGDPGIE